MDLGQGLTLMLPAHRAHWELSVNEDEQPPPQHLLWKLPRASHHTHLVSQGLPPGTQEHGVHEDLQEKGSRLSGGKGNGGRGASRHNFY